MNAAVRARQLLEEGYRVREDNPKFLAAFRYMVFEAELQDVHLRGRCQSGLSARDTLRDFLALSLPLRFQTERTMKRWWTVARAFPWAPENLLKPGHSERTLLKFVAIDKLEAMSRLPEIEKRRLLSKHRVTLGMGIYSAQDIKHMKVADLRKLMKV